MTRYPNKRRTTIRDVAKSAGVSPITASRALSGSDKVQMSTRAKVEAAAKELHYIPNLTAGTFSSNVSKLVAVIVPNLSNSIFADTLQALADALRPSGYELLIGHSDYDLEKEETLIRAFLSRQADAIVLTGHIHSDGACDMLTAANIPIVEMWSLSDQPLDISVGISNFDAAKCMTEHLVQRGCQEVGLICGYRDGNDRTQARIDGYKSTLRDHGLRIDDALIAYGPFEFETGATAIRKLRERNPAMDGVFAASDIIALGAYLECLRLGVAVPEELALGGMDDLYLARLTAPGLTTIAVPRHDIGRKVGEVILERLAGRPSKAQSFDLGFKFIRRGTT